MSATRQVDNETKNKMSISAKERNVIPPSRKGTCWIIKNNDCKSIKVEELNDYILNGWMLGRKIIKNN